MRSSSKKLNPSLKKQLEDVFAQTVSDLKDFREADVFLRDFFTKSEYELFTKRLAVAYWLSKKRSYENIKANLKVSSATIAAVRLMLEKKGLQSAIKKIEAEEWASQWSKKIKKVLGAKP